jgi:hypothetical protein
MEKIIKKLISVGYPENAAKATAMELSQIDSSLNNALASWMDNEVETDMTIEGFTLSELQAKHKMAYPAALLTMDWLIKEPSLAKVAINKGIK